MRLLLISIVLLGVVVGMLWASKYDASPLLVTNEDEYKIVQFAGNPYHVQTEPGVWFHFPPVTNVRRYDARLQYLNAEPVEMLIANNEKLIVDYYAIWRITDPLQFLNAFPSGMPQAESRIKRTINSSVQGQVARLSLAELLSRAEILSTLGRATSAELAEDGVEIVDVRVSRTELPRQAEPAAYGRMEEQRRAVSRERRASGERQAREIRAAAERDARIEIAKAKAESEVIMGEGDAEAAGIYAKAYNKDPDFYAFVRSLEAYRKTLGDRTVMVMAPDHEFFRFLQPELALKDDLSRNEAPAVTEPGVDSLPDVASGPAEAP